MRRALLLVGVIATAHGGEATTNPDPLHFSEQPKRDDPAIISRPDGAFVDYDSKVIVGIDSDGIKAWFDVHDPGAGVQRREELKRIKEQVEGFSALLTKVEELIRDRNSAFADLLATAPGTADFTESQHRLQLVLKRQKAQAQAVIELALGYINLRLFAGRLPRVASIDQLMREVMEHHAEQREAVLAEITRIDSMIRQGGDLAPRGIAELLTNYALMISQLLDRPLAGELELAMDARLVREGGGVLPVSIEPYVTVDGVNGQSKSKRLGMPSPEDQERLAKQFELSQRYAQDLERMRSDHRALLSQLRERIRAELATLETDLLQHLLALGSQAIDIPLESYPHLHKLKDTIISLQRYAESWHLYADGKNMDPVTLLALARSTAGELMKLYNLWESQQTLVSECGALAAQLTGEAKEAALKMKQVAAASLSKGLTDLKTGVLGDTSVLEKLDQQRAFAEIDSAAIHRRTLPIAQAKDGTVDLHRTPAEPGDELQLTVSLVRSAGARSETTVVRETEMEVRKFNWYTTFNSQVLLVDRLHDDTHRMVFVPSVSINLHYRSRSRGRFLEWFNEWIAPGVGMNVAVPNFENSTEVGVGMQVTVGNDFLQCGFGRNVSVDENPNYWYIGVDIVKPMMAFYRSMPK